MRARDVVGGRFEVIGFHRAGGMGEVFRARDTQTGKDVALKLITKTLGNAEQRFEREVVILAEMRDPGIVEYVAHGDAPDGRRFLAMEWLDGEDLGERILHSALSPMDAVDVALAITRALASAHARGVVHRDLKPQNVFLVGDDPARAKLLDFGLARSAGPVPNITRTGMTVGTRGYMAPEQALGEKNVGAKADLFALGCVIHEAVVGRAPFRASEPEEVMRKIVFEDVAPLAELRVGVAPELSALVAALMEKEPDARPTDAAAVVVALEAIASKRASALVDGWEITVIEGPDAGQRRVAGELPLDIGKHPSAALALSDRSASRFHCELRMDDGRAVACDLASTNGLTVDGNVVRVAPVRDGSILGIGRSRLLLRATKVPREPTALERACAEDANAIVRGGGKSALDLALSIHDESTRRRGPFVVLMGDSYRASEIARASGGIAFVRDVERMSPADQDALATLLESRATCVDGVSTLVDARIVAASTGDLRLAVNDGRFRPALYAALAGVRLATT